MIENSGDLNLNNSVIVVFINGWRNIDRELLENFKFEWKVVSEESNGE